VRTATLVAALALAAGVLAGCGGSSSSSGDRSQIDQLIADLTSASQVGDGNKICTQIFAPGLEQAVTSAAKKPCASVVATRLFSPKASFKVNAVSIRGTSASARVTDQTGRVSIFTLVKQNGGWRLLGVAPAAG
jgi:hypothetical protein